MAAIDEQIRLYAKHLEVPTFAEYEQVLRQAEPRLGLCLHRNLLHTLHWRNLASC